MTDKLFLTDAEVGAKLNIPTVEIKAAMIVFERRGFPPKDPEFGDRRYWPAIKEWLDRRYRVGPFSTLGNNAQIGVRK